MKYVLTILLLIIFLPLSSQDLEDISEAEPFKIDGSISVGGFQYAASGLSNRLPSVGYSAYGNANISVYGVQIPLFLSFNQQGTRFSQPFNRFGLSPEYKWIKLHLGHRNLFWSPFTLAGNTILGAGVELTPGKFRFTAITGRLQQPVSFGSTAFTLPEYNRRATGFKIGFGDESSHIDLIYLKGKDNSNSLTFPTDSVADLYPPKENVTLGLNTRFPIIEEKLSFNLNSAVSAMTEDTRFETISLENYEQYRWLTDIFLLPNVSTHLNYAVEASLDLTLKKVNVSAKYRKVMPEYNSMGVNYLLTDLENYTINPSVNLLNGKLLLSGSLGLQYNNLDQRLDQNTNRIIGSLSANASVNSNFSVFGQYSNYSLYQQVFRDTLTNDSLLINQINHNLMISPRLSFFNEQTIQNISLTFNYQALDDKQSTTEQLSENNLINIGLNYAVTLRSISLNLNAGVYYFDFNANMISNSQAGLNIGGNKKFIEDKLKIGLTNVFSFTETNGQNGFNYNLNIDASYAVTPKNKIRLNSYVLSNNNPSQNFTETRNQLSFTHQF